MSKKISPRVREQAAIYCNIMANWWIGEPVRLKDDRPSDDVLIVAFGVYRFVQSKAVHGDESSINLSEACNWAEAEALLRTGWEP